MQILTAGERKEFTLNNIKLDGFTLNLKLTSSIFSHSPQNVSVDFSKTMLKVILKRDGQQWTIIQDDLRVLGLSCNLFTFSRRAFFQDHNWHIPLVYSTAAINGVSILPFDIDFGGTLDIKGTDELLVELTLDGQIFSANINPALSFLEIKPRKSVGFERAVPYIRSYGIAAGERRRTFDLGNMVTACYLINLDQLTVVNPVVSSVTLTSKQFNETFSLSDLVNTRYSNRPDPGLDPTASIGQHDEFDQCYELFKDVELDAVKVDIQFNPANVIANNNLLVVRSAYTDVKTLIEHDAKVLKEQNEKIAELKQNGENAKIV